MNTQTQPNSQDKEHPQRFSFLLRLWCTGETGRSDWRASLEMPASGKRLGFANLEQLFVYLIDLSENRNDQPGRKCQE